MRYAAKNDSNALELVDFARRMGAFVVYVKQPTDLLVYHGDRWWLVEVKNPEMEGRKKEYTKAQKKFLEDIKPFGAQLWVWRSVSDVQRDLGARSQK